MIKTKTILGISLAAIFAVSMMMSPVAFATSGTPSPDRTIDEADDFEMETVGNNPGQTTDGHDILVYAFFTNTPGAAPNSFVAYVAAFHPTFADDDEQIPDITAVHAHQLELNNDSLCIEALTVPPTVEIEDEEIEIEDAEGEVVAWVIAGYDVTGAGICPTHVYDLVEANDDNEDDEDDD